MPSKNNKAYVVAVDMGYGHRRAVFPLRDIAICPPYLRSRAGRKRGNIIVANDYEKIPAEDKKIWDASRELYEKISRFKHVPIVGEIVWSVFDKFQSIPSFYPRRDLSKPNLQLREIMFLIEKKKWGKDLIDKLNRNPRPLITSFFAIAFMAEHFGYKEDIYCLICDADISRTWVSQNPKKSKIKYFAPCYRVEERLKLYGVPPDNIFLTGFPLPKENLGGPGLGVLKNDLWHRIYNLDPLKKYTSQYEQSICRHLKVKSLPKKTNHPLTLTFVVGGAGAQREIAMDILESLKAKILDRKIKVILVAGSRKDVYKDFQKMIKQSSISQEFKRNGFVEIIFKENKSEYFKKFNETLRKTDILWTKPSELCFYTALGLPIIMAPAIGSQEEFNKLWLKAIGAGISQEDPKHTDEWLFDWLNSGWLAEAAMQGYFEAFKFGTYNIEKIISHREEEIKEMKIIQIS
jgi:RNA-binding protein YhbY